MGKTNGADLMRSATASGPRGKPAREARLVASGGVPVNDALGGHLVDERNGLLQGVLRGLHVVAVDGGADVPERVAQARPILSVAFIVLQALTMRFERRCMTGHVDNYLQNR